MKLENRRLTLCVAENRLKLTDKRTGNVYETRPLAGQEWTEISENRFELKTDGVRIAECRVSLGEDYAELTLNGKGAMETLPFPGPWKVRADDLCLYPVGTGICFAGNDLKNMPAEEQELCWGAGLSMAMWGMQRGNGVLMTALEHPWDAWLRTAESPDGTVESVLNLRSQKGKWGYARRLRIFAGDSIAAVCASVRRWREELGNVRTLAEKMAHTPGVEKLLGAADVWFWDDNNMNRLYFRPEVPEETPRDVRRVALEMKELGMDRILWNSFEGETPEDCAFLKEQGFLVGKYDIYRDVIPGPAREHVIPYRLKRGEHHFKNWPGDVRMEEDGSLADAWQLHTLDGTMCYQNSICDMCALRMTMEDVPPEIERVGYTSRFIDVQGGSSGSECWNPLHPCTRGDSLRYIRTQTEFLTDLGLVAGVEAGHEGTVLSYHFSEGTISPFQFRQEDAGRRMTSEFYGDDVPEQIRNGMLNAALRVPLWELVYHDCAVNYWYWGDSANCCPDYLPVRDQFDALYGYPPLYSLTATQWERLKERIAASYKRATQTARRVALLPMTGFDWLTEDRMVQRTVFGGEVAVTANFSGADYILPDGSVVKPGEWKTEELNE